VSGFIRAVEAFFEQFSAVGWDALGLALLCHLAKIVCRTRSWRNILAAAYPEMRVSWRGVFGSHIAGVGVNAVIPARGGDVLKLYLVKRRIEGSTYPTLAATLLVETMFDFVVATGLLLWAIRLGVLPGLDVLPNFQAFDWAWMWRHPYETIAIAGALLLGVTVAAVRASPQLLAFKRRVRQGFAILRTPVLYARRVLAWQALDWGFRLATVYFFLRAFDLVPSVHNALLVQVTQSLSTILPFTPAGIGTEQALLVYVFAGEFGTSSLLSFSIGMKLSLIAFNLVLGFGAIALMLRTFRWRRLVEPEHGLG
jgi:uncharacterized membrane protein YbhN (UPF0104 family)